MKYILRVFSVYLVSSIIFGGLSLPASASNVKNSSNIPGTQGIILKEKTNIIQKDYVEGEVLVKYKNNKINLDTSSGRTAALSFNGSKSLEIKENLVKNNISVLKIKDSKTVEQKVAELQNDPNVEYAEPNYKRYPAVISSNDTNKGLLWGLDNTGQIVNGVSGTSDADIDAPEAWAISEATTSTTIIVAVIDTGVAYNHPDLIANMWDGINCKDENGNALGSCNHGYDYEDGDKTPLPSTSAHGTHVAGIIGAVKNNSTGVIGVAQNVKIMAIKFNFTISEEIKAIDFAIQNGAKVINASFVGPSFSQFEYDAINRFKTAGIFVAAAGNGGSDQISDNNDLSPQYPANHSLDNIISVAATDQNDALTTFSNYGVTSVDVGAPGTNIYSTVPLETIISSENFEEVTPPAMPSGWVTGGTNNHWGTYNRTSTWGSNWGIVLYGDTNPIYESNSSSTASSPAYNLSTASGANIDFSTACDTEYNPSSWTDYMALELSSDGGSNFTEVLRWDEPFIDSDTNPSGSAAYNFTTNIPSQYLTSNFKFQFRWVTNGNADTGSIGDGCAVNNITIDKLSDGSDEQYGYLYGTSMATPYVAGLVALIEGYNSGLTYSHVKNIILTTGDNKASLSGKTVSGKRVNAYNALVASNPAKAITSFTIPTQVGSTTINESAHTIALNVPYGTNLTALVPSITITGASVSPASGVAHNFTATSTYTVTAADASTQAYTVTVIVNAPSSVATVTSETYTVNNASSTITGVPYATASSTFLTALTKGESHQTWNISNLSNPILTNNTLVVTAQDGITTKTYTVTVNAPSSVVTVTSVIYIIDDASSTITNIPYRTASSTFLTALTKGESHQTWNIDNISSLVLSDDTLVVTAQDGTTTLTYTMTVNLPSLDATLRNLTISNGTLSPIFSTSTTAYTVSVSNSISSVTVTPTQNEPHSTIKVNSITTTSGSVSSPISLIVGSNLISIEVIAEDNTSTSTYTITVTRAAASGGVGVNGGSVGSGGGGINYYSITASAGTNGAVSPIGATSVTSGNNQTYTITPATGYRIASVIVDGTSVGTGTTYTFSGVTANHTISATFSAITLPVVAKSGDANGDGKIDKYDFSLMMFNWGKTGNNVCDFNNDGKVDKYDFSLLMLNWNK